MAKKKLNLNELSDVELADKLKDDNAQFTRMKFNHSVSHIENPTRIRSMRRDIARINTELTRREAAAGKQVTNNGIT